MSNRISKLREQVDRLDVKMNEHSFVSTTGKSAVELPKAANEAVADHVSAVDDAAVERLRALIDEMDRRVADTSPALGRSDTRERILEMAIGLFAQRGFEACTVRDLADAVGIKPPGLYSHFKSKEDILSEAMLRALRGFLADACAPTAAAGAPARLHETVRRHIIYQLEHAQLTRAHDLLLNSKSVGQFLPEAERQLLHDARRAYYELIRARVAAASKPVSDLDLTTSTFAILTLCDGVVNWYRPEGELTAAQVADRYWDLISLMLQIA
ncbi:TetR/AcrR family transcriptional regulator [Nocardia sp. NPDC059091]|uniref:TetR/AcrR family transcriptional regulator n=1 Tax=Nocardia sp. NPDC059091 TaxID=3346724 RepID=UPI0036917003